MKRIISLLITLCSLSAMGQNPVSSSNKQIIYSPPKNLMPADGKKFTEQEGKQPMQFKWTAVRPPPPVNDDIMYTVYVYAVQKGKSPAQAAKTNKPVFEKQVNTTQTVWQVPLAFTSSNEKLTFVWNVQATYKNGKLITGDVPNGEGRSEASVFYIARKEIIIAH